MRWHGPVLAAAVLQFPDAPSEDVWPTRIADCEVEDRDCLVAVRQNLLDDLECSAITYVFSNCFSNFFDLFENHFLKISKIFVAKSQEI